jgi:hypothetical protein
MVSHRVSGLPVVAGAITVEGTMQGVRRVDNRLAVEQDRSAG